MREKRPSYAQRAAIASPMIGLSTVFKNMTMRGMVLLWYACSFAV